MYGWSLSSLRSAKVDYDGYVKETFAWLTDVYDTSNDFELNAKFDLLCPAVHSGKDFRVGL